MESPKKLQIEARDDNDKKVGSYTALINPNELEAIYSTKFTAGKPPKKKLALAASDYSMPPTLSMNFLFDGTGTVASKSASSKAVIEQIDEFRRVLYDTNSDDQRPHHLIMIWGDFKFRGQVLIVYDVL